MTNVKEICLGKKVKQFHHKFKPMRSRNAIRLDLARESIDNEAQFGTNVVVFEEAS